MSSFLLGFCLSGVLGGVLVVQLSRAEEKMNGLDGCYCERTCSVKGVVYREDESWTDGCRNCTCTVGLLTRVLDCFCVHASVCVCVCLTIKKKGEGTFGFVIVCI